MNCLKWKVEVERSVGIVMFDNLDRFASKNVLQNQKFKQQTQDMIVAHWHGGHLSDYCRKWANLTSIYFEGPENVWEWSEVNWCCCSEVNSWCFGVAAINNHTPPHVPCGVVGYKNLFSLCFHGNLDLQCKTTIFKLLRWLLTNWNPG